MEFNEVGEADLGGEVCKVLEPLNLLFISPEYLQGLHFSATMPKAKN